MIGAAARRGGHAAARPISRLLYAAAAVSAALLPGCRKQPATIPDAPSVQVRFDDVSTAAGVRFSHYTGAEGRFWMPESVGSGGALFDYDGDGRLDLFLVNCTNWPDRPAAGKVPALYRNMGGGSFRDTTQEAGLADPLFGMGCAVGDFDNDGHDDLFVTCLGRNRLFRNLGGRFREVTGGSGLEVSRPWDWHTSAAWVDYDRDGLLDLYVCRYVKWTPESDVPCTTGSGGRTYCGPNLYAGQSDLLYRNLGGGKFRDVSVQAGIEAAAGKGLGVLPIDENDDGWPDLLVTNDTTPNVLWRNEAGKRFTDVGQEVGVAVDDTGKARAGMGVGAADVRNNGGLSFAIGNFTREGLSLYQRGDTLYSDAASTAGLTPASLDRVTFGLVFLDADRDGWQDLFAYNGHVHPHISETGTPVTWKQLPLYFRNVRGAFREATAEAGRALQEPQLGRGCAWGDFDDDGRPDLLLCENGGPARLLRNATPDTHHWAGFQLRGKKGNRNAYGAEVRLTAGGMTQRRWVRSGGSYLSHSDTRALFGLGDAAAIERIEIQWPSGETSTLDAPDADRYHEVWEP